MISNELVTETVEKRLNDVTYSEDLAYVPTAFALEYVNFIKMVNGEEGEENLTPVLHYHVLDQLGGKKKNIANLLFRGSAKTTLCGEYLFPYIAMYGGIPSFGSIPLALYVSDSIENGVKNMRKNLEYRYEKSEFLKEFIPHIRFTDTRWEFTNIDGKKFIVKAYGAKTGVRGTKELGTRPMLAVLDDLVSDDDARSDTVLASIEDTVYRAVNFALHPTRSKIIWNGTPFNSKDPLYKAIESGSWYANVFPICENFPCEKKDFKGAWEDRFPYSYVRAEYDMALKLGKLADFYQELMLRIMSEEDRLIQDCDIMWYKFREIKENLSYYNIYITTDFATSSKTSSDFSVIAVWALNHNGDWFWLDGIVKKQLMDKNIDDLFRLVQKYRPLEVGIEVSGQQAGFIPWIMNEMMRKNNFFSLASEGNSNKPGIRPTTDKIQRFNIAVPWFKSKKMWFPEEKEHTPEVIEFMQELSLATVGQFKSKHDDCLDSISQLASLKTFLPNNPETVLENLIKGKTRNDLWEDAEIVSSGGRMNSYIV